MTSTEKWFPPAFILESRDFNLAAVDAMIISAIFPKGKRARRFADIFYASRMSLYESSEMRIEKKKEKTRLRFEIPE